MSADGHIEIEVELNSEKAEKELDSLSKNLEKTLHRQQRRQRLL